MNKREFFEGFMIFIFILGVLGVGFVWVVVPLIEQNSLEKWCIEEGFDGGNHGTLVWEKSYCNKIEENVLTKVEIETCKIDGRMERCFVLVGGDEK